MSYMPGFCQNVGSNYTFQNNMQNFPTHFPLPPPPLPPMVPSFLLTPELSDQEYIKTFESCICKEKLKSKVNSANLSELHENLYTLVISLNDIQVQEGKLCADVGTLSEDEWNSALGDLEVNKNIIKNMLSRLSSSYWDMSRKLLAKRTAKRLRLKRLRVERKREKKERIKQLEERSRKIDENLQKIKDDIQKAKQEEEVKMRADIILKEVLRKKQDAKKSIAKLEALLKLRRARQNTARGRGQPVSDTEATTFHNNIERIKKLWEVKWLTYEKEEADTRMQLKKSNEQNDCTSAREQEVMDNLGKWREALFGGSEYPQVDFKGDTGRFIAVRSQWDSYIDNGMESTPLPMGWVVPNSDTYMRSDA